MVRLAVLVLTLFAATSVWAQARYDLLLKGGHVVDPRNGIDRVIDVAIAGGKIARVAENIAAAEAKKVVDVTGRTTQRKASTSSLTGLR